MAKEIDIIRAWKDEDYRNSLTPEQLAQIPPNPAGDVELSEEDLDGIAGGLQTNDTFTLVPIPKIPPPTSNATGLVNVCKDPKV